MDFWNLLNLTWDVLELGTRNSKRTTPNFKSDFCQIITIENFFLKKIYIKKIQNSALRTAYVLELSTRNSKRSEKKNYIIKFLRSFLHILQDILKFSTENKKNYLGKTVLKIWSQICSFFCIKGHKNERKNLIILNILLTGGYSVQDV